VTHWRASWASMSAAMSRSAAVTKASERVDTVAGLRWWVVGLAQEGASGERAKDGGGEDGGELGGGHGGGLLGAGVAGTGGVARCPWGSG
jgi:hypothetical protein